MLRVFIFSIKSFTLPTEVKHSLHASLFCVAGRKAQCNVKESSFPVDRMKCKKKDVLFTKSYYIKNCKYKRIKSLRLRRAKNFKLKLFLFFKYKNQGLGRSSSQTYNSSEFRHYCVGLCDLFSKNSDSIFM